MHSCKVYISACSRRSPEWGMILKIQTAMQYAAKHDISTTLKPLVGESLICRARQNALYDFYEREYDYLLTIDDDIELPEDAIVKLVNDDKDIVGGFYRLRQDKARTAVRIFPPKPDFNVILKDGLLVPVIYVSTGCMLIKRNVVTKMIEEYPELHYTANLTNNKQWAFYQPYIYQNEYLSEDWAFCQRAYDAGFVIWADGSVRCGHWGLIKYDFE